MYLLTAFIGKTDKVHELIHEMKENGFTGGSWFDCLGMKTAIPNVLDHPMVVPLHLLFDEEGQLSKALFSVVESMDEVKRLTDLIEKVIGDLDSPGTGLVIAQEIAYSKGFKILPNIQY